MDGPFFGRGLLSDPFYSSTAERHHCYFESGRLIMTEKVHEFIWQALCGKCDAGFELDTEVDEKPHPNGIFCPDCMKKNSTLKGVLHFMKVS